MIMILDTDVVKPRSDPSSTQTSKALPGRNTFSLDTNALEDKPKAKKKEKKEHRCCVLGPFQKREHELIE